MIRFPPSVTPCASQRNWREEAKALLRTTCRTEPSSCGIAGHYNPLVISGIIRKRTGGARFNRPDQRHHHTARTPF